MNIGLTVICLLIMLVGLVGTILPVLPGLPLIYLGYLLYGLFTSWQSFGAGTMIFWGIIVAATLAVEYFAGPYGARRSGASILGVWGSIIGGVIGLVSVGLIGLVIGTFAGAVAGELIQGRPPGEAMRSGKGALVGFLAGSLFKVVIGLIMIGVFLWQVAVK